MLKESNVIVGGGIVGLLSAWYLVESGQAVVVLDKKNIGKESSWAGAGILTPLYPNRYPSLLPLLNPSLNEYRRITAQLIALSGLDPELVSCRLIVIDEATAPFFDEMGKPAELLPIANVKLLEPELNVEAGRALSYSSAHIRSPRFVAALRSALSKLGVTFIEGCGVVRFMSEAGVLHGLVTTKGFLKANRCLVAAGAWTGELLKAVGLHLPIRPIKGQIIAVAARPGLISHIVVKDYHYLVPRKDGRILIGSTLESTGFAKETTQRARHELYAAATDLIPPISKYPIEYHWAGLRPGSPDDAPFIGEHPEIRGLFVCAGHYRNGFATGVASAGLVVDLMLGRPPAIDPTSFRIDRQYPAWQL